MQHVKPDRCIFCAALELPDGPGNLIVARGQHTFLILNRYPYTSGHVMVVPYAHASDLAPLDAAVRSEIMETMVKAQKVLEEIYHPDGMNIGANIGAAAGAGVVGHVHFHVVPRWGGDTNFMSTIGNTRVLPEDLEQTYQRIRTLWETALA